jgi:hypothetical protein
MESTTEDLFFTKICKVKKAKEQNHIEHDGKLYKYTIIDKVGEELVVDPEFYVRVSINKVTLEVKIIPFKADAEFVNELLKHYNINEHQTLLHSVNDRNGQGLFKLNLNGHIFRLILHAYQFSDNQILDKNIKLTYIENTNTSRFEMVQAWGAFTPSTINFDKIYDANYVVKDVNKHKYYIKEFNYYFYMTLDNIETVRIREVRSDGKLAFKKVESRRFISPESIFSCDFSRFLKSHIFSDDYEVILQQILSKNNNYLLTTKNTLLELISSKFRSRDIEEVKKLVPFAIELHEGALRYKYHEFFDKVKSIKVKQGFQTGLYKYRKYLEVLDSNVIGVINRDLVSSNQIESITNFQTVLELSNNLYYTEQEVLDFTLMVDPEHSDGSFLDIYMSHKISYIFERFSRLTTSSRSRIFELAESSYSVKRRHLFQAYVKMARSSFDLSPFRQNLLYRTFLIDYIYKCIRKNVDILPIVFYNISELNKYSFSVPDEDWLKQLTPRSNYMSGRFNIEIFLKNPKLYLNISREKFILEINQKSANLDANFNIQKIAQFPLSEIREISLESFNTYLETGLNGMVTNQVIDAPVVIKEIKYFPDKNKTIVFGLIFAKDGKRTDCILQLSKTWITEFGRFGKYDDLKIGLVIPMQIKLISSDNESKRYVGFLPDRFLLKNSEISLKEFVNYRVIGHPDLSNEIILPFLSGSNEESNQVASICSSCGGGISIDFTNGSIVCAECDYQNSFYLVLENLESHKILYLNYQIISYYCDKSQLLDLFKKINLNAHMRFENNVLKVIHRNQTFKPTIDATIFILIALYNSDSRVTKIALWEGLSALAATMKSQNSYLFRLYYLASKLLDRIGSDSFDEIDKQEFSEGISRLALDNARFEDSLESIEGIKLLEYLWREIDVQIYEGLTSSNIEIRRISEIIVLYKLIGAQFPSEARNFKRITIHLKNLIFDQMESASFNLLVNPEVRESSIIESILSGKVVEDVQNEFKETLWKPVMTSDSHLKIQKLNEELKKLPISSKEREELETTIKKISFVDQSKDKIKLVKFSTFKNICAMLNTRGGRIVIGIRDVKGLPMEGVGLISDYQEKIVDFDALIGVYHSAGKTFIKDWVSMWSAYCHPKKEVFDGKEFLIIEIDQVSSKTKDLCYINFEDDERVYIRTPHGAETLPVSDIRDYRRPKRVEDDVEETSVYLMSSKSSWKIGMSNNPERRLGTLTPDTKNLKLEFYAIFPGRRDAKKIEDYLKERFVSKKVEGTTEFFYLSHSDVELVKTILKSQIQVVDIFDSAQLQSMIS